MSMEAGVVLGRRGDVIHWHVPDGRTLGSLPDSRTLWDVLWENRHRVTGFAHSHPGDSTYPSSTDVSTFRAIELGLGKELDWFILGQTQIAICRLYPGTFKTWDLTGETPYYYQPWIDELRRLSYGADL